MTTLLKALQSKFEDLVSDAIASECIIKRPIRSDKAFPICARVIALDHQEITSIGDTKELVHIFENVCELDLSTNHIHCWADIFALLECSPKLQLLNLSYNPLRNSPLHSEIEEIDDITNQTIDSSTNISASSSDFTTCSQFSDSCNAFESAFSEENKNEFINSHTRFLRAPSLLTSCLSHQLNTLLLNSTQVLWSRVLHLLNYLPNLTTLHAALNDYSSCCPQGGIAPRFPQVTHLYFSENRLTSWSDVCCLASHFPGLQHLVLLRNPLQVIPPMGEEKEATPFPKLEDLNLTETRIDTWESVDTLTQWFPDLKLLRLGKDLPLFENGDTQTLRYDVISRVPTLTSYNGTSISEEERERAERDFIRRFGQVDAVRRPQRFWELEKRHGYVAPLVSVNLAPKKSVRLRIRFDGQEEKYHSCCLRHSIARLRQEVCALFGLTAHEARSTRLVYFDAGIVEVQGPEEMRPLSRLLYTYHPSDGDALLITRRS